MAEAARGLSARALTITVGGRVPVRAAGELVKAQRGLRAGGGGAAVRWWIAALLVSLAACTSSPDRAQSQDGPGPTVPAEVDSAVESFLDGGYQGQYEDVRAVLVLVGERLVVERYLHEDAERSTSNVASVTKSVMSLLIGIAVDQGLLSVDQTLETLLPQYSAVMAPELRTATLRQVLTMTAGLPEDGPASNMVYETAQDWVAATLAGGAVGAEGEFAYSSAGSQLLSAILVQATGRPVLESAREHLLEPLGIQTVPAAEPVADYADPAAYQAYDAADFAWPVDRQGHHVGYCCLKIDVAAMLALGRLMRDGGVFEDRRLVSASWVAESTRSHVPTDGGLADEYGYQWWVTTAGGHPAFAASGFGGQLIEVVPELDLVVVVSSDLRDVPTVDSQQFVAMVDLLIAPAVACRDQQRC